MNAITAPTVTAGQAAVLRAILTNDFTAYNGRVPGDDYVFDASDFDVWSNCIDCATRIDGLPRGRALGATVSTLSQAGLVTVSGTGRDACVRFTRAGYDAARAVM